MGEDRWWRIKPADTFNNTRCSAALVRGTEKKPRESKKKKAMRTSWRVEVLESDKTHQHESSPKKLIRAKLVEQGRAARGIKKKRAGRSLE